MARKPTDELSDQEAEARANAAMLRALNTPYKPQSDMKIGAKEIGREIMAKKTKGTSGSPARPTGSKIKTRIILTPNPPPSKPPKRGR